MNSQASKLNETPCKYVFNKINRTRIWGGGGGGNFCLNLGKVNIFLEEVLNQKIRTSSRNLGLPNVSGWDYHLVKRYLKAFQIWLSNLVTVISYFKITSRALPMYDPLPTLFTTTHYFTCNTTTFKLSLQAPPFISSFNTSDSSNPPQR
jgi:hypothetical protein